MGCNLCQQLLPEYLMGECGETTQQQMAQHLATCDACNREYHSLKEVVDYFQDDPLEYDLTATHQEILQHAQKEKKTNYLYPAIISTIAALFLAAISMLLFGDNIRDTFGASASALSAHKEIASKDHFRDKDLNSFAPKTTKATKDNNTTLIAKATLLKEIRVAKANNIQNDNITKGGSGIGSQYPRSERNHLKKNVITSNALPPLTDLSKVDEKDHTDKIIDEEVNVEQEKAGKFIEKKRRSYSAKKASKKSYRRATRQKSKQKSYFNKPKPVAKIHRQNKPIQISKKTPKTAEGSVILDDQNSEIATGMVQSQSLKKIKNIQEKEEILSLETLFQSKNYQQIITRLKDQKERTRREQIYYYRSLLKLKRCDQIQKDEKIAFKYLSQLEQEQYHTICKSISPQH